MCSFFLELKQKLSDGAEVAQLSFWKDLTRDHITRPVCWKWREEWVPLNLASNFWFRQQFLRYFCVFSSGINSFLFFPSCWSPSCLHSIEYLCEFHPAIYLLKALREWFQRSVCSPWKSKVNLSVVCVTATVTFEGRNNTFFFLQVKCWIIERNYIHLLIQWLCC